MRSDRRTELKRSKREKFWRFTKGWSLLFFVLTALFCIGVALSKLFSWKIIAAGVGALVLILLLTVPPMRIRRFKHSRRVIAFIVSLVMIAAYAMGGFYLIGALDFIGSITTRVDVQSYYVVVRDDDTFSDIKDIAGEEVVAFRSGEGFARAEEDLLKAVDCSIVDSDDLFGMVNGLLSGDNNVLLMNSANYISVSDRLKGDFDDYTKILEVIRVQSKKESSGKNVKVTSQPFNVVITGLDVDGSIENESRSDVNILATVNPVTKEVLLTSIPRDYYVLLPGMGDNAYDKLTHTGLYGAEETVAAVESLLGIDVNYYVKVNYSTVVRVVEAIGGIDVYSDYEFTTNGQDWYYFEQGDIHLNGYEALAFARERQAFEDGDFQRNKNQQKVLAAIIKKMTSSTTLLTNYTDILAAVKENLEMNMSADEIKALVRMQTDDMASWNIQSQSIIGDLDLLPCYALGGEYASVVKADVRSIEDAKVRIFEVMGKTYEPDYDNWDYYSPDMVSGLDGDDYSEDWSESSDYSGESDADYSGDEGSHEGGGGEDYTDYSDEGSGSDDEGSWDDGSGSGDEGSWDDGSGSGDEGSWDDGSGSGDEGSWDEGSGGSGEGESYDGGESGVDQPSHSLTTSKE